MTYCYRNEKSILVIWSFQECENARVRHRYRWRWVAEFKEPKSHACKLFLFLMDCKENPSYKENLEAVIKEYPKVNRELLEQEIDMYM